MITKDKLQILSDFMDSEAGKESIREYFGGLKRQNTVRDLQIDRLYKHALDGKFDTFVEKVVSKYSSHMYKQRWYGRGIEPPEDLYFMMHDIAKKYGREFTPKEYGDMENSMFTNTVYVFMGWKFELIVGQGCAVLVERYAKEIPSEITMKKPDLAGWQVITNAQGVDMAMVNRDKLIDTMKYIEYLEEKLKNTEE